MTITDTKVVSEIAAIQVGTEDEGVLVYFIRVVGNESHSSCECVLCYDVSLNEHWSKCRLRSFCHTLAWKHSGWGRGSRLEFVVKRDLVLLLLCEVSRLTDSSLFRRWILRLMGASWRGDLLIHKVIDLLRSLTVWLWDLVDFRLLLLKQKHHHQVLLRLLISLVIDSLSTVGNWPLFGSTWWSWRWLSFVLLQKSLNTIFSQWLGLPTSVIRWCGSRVLSLDVNFTWSLRSHIQLVLSGRTFLRIHLTNESSTCPGPTRVLYLVFLTYK